MIQFLIFQRFIRPFLFGREKPKFSVEDAVSEINKTVEKSVAPTKASVAKVNEYIYEMKEQNRNILSTVRDIKADLVNLKAMLLSRYLSNFCSSHTHYNYLLQQYSTRTQIEMLCIDQ